MNGIKEYRIAVDANIIGIERVNPGDGKLNSEIIKQYDTIAQQDTLGSISKIIAVNAAQRSVQYALNNYGKLTGDYVLQDQINSFFEITGLSLMALSGTTGVAATAAVVGAKVIDRIVEVNSSKVVARNMQARLNITNSRSRY